MSIDVLPVKYSDSDSNSIMSIEKRDLLAELQVRRKHSCPVIFYPDSTTHTVLRSYLYAKCVERTDERNDKLPKRNIPFDYLSFFLSFIPLFIILFDCVIHSSDVKLGIVWPRFLRQMLTKDLKRLTKTNAVYMK